MRKYILAVGVLALLLALPLYAAFDPTVPDKDHNAYSDILAMKENFAQLRKFESGASSPANTVSGMFWHDTSASPYTVKQRNDANNGWLTLWTSSTTPYLHRTAATLDHPDGSVTNAKLAASGLSASKMTTGTLPAAQLPTIPWTKLSTSPATEGSVVIDPGDYWTPAAGVYLALLQYTWASELYVSGAWRGQFTTTSGGLQFFVTNGSRVRFKALETSQTVYYLKF